MHCGKASAHASPKRGCHACDTGLGEWLFDLDAVLQCAVPEVLAMAKDPAASNAVASKVREFVQQRQETMKVLRASLPA
ncbi:MAG: hypothetical protein ACOYMN_03905 [Roseimicrobium sp.]